MKCPFCDSIYLNNEKGLVFRCLDCFRFFKYEEKV